MEYSELLGKFGSFGGRFVPETLMDNLIELEKEYLLLKDDPEFKEEMKYYLNDYVGRPTPLYFSGSLSRKYNCRIYLKREDLCHTGAHKINNCIGQALLAKKMGKKRIIAETGAGQHGVAAATVCALLGLDCVVYMGEVDHKRQAVNQQKMRILGAEVRIVDSGTKTLKDAVNEAVRDWVANVSSSHYLLGSAVGPHPYPLMVRDFQSIIGRETKRQILTREQRLPDFLIACVGGGSNSIGFFYPFLNDKNVRMIGVEAGGKSDRPGENAASLGMGRPGILHGAYSYILQDAEGRILPTHSISAGLDYPGVGPELSYLMYTGRLKVERIRDEEALQAFYLLSQLEGILPALESSHALAYQEKLTPFLSSNSLIVINLSGRGDKDLDIINNRRI